MKTRIVTLSEVDDDLLARWHALAECAIEPNAFLDPRILRPGGHPNEVARDMRFLLVEDEEQLHVVMAFETGFYRVVRVPFRSVFLGYFPYTSRKYPLVAPQRPIEALTTLLRNIPHFCFPP